MLFVSGGSKNIMVEITGSMSLEQAQKMTDQVANNDTRKNSDDND